MKAQIKKFKVNTFYKIAEEYKHTLTSEEDLEKRDVTTLFYKELNYMVKIGEIIKLQVNGKMRLGKSTVGISIGYDIFEMLKKSGMKNKKEKFGVKNIARDQQEYSKLMRNPDLSFDIIVVDEDNELEKTGENSSTEGALSKVISDVQAGRYVHDIKISPKGLNDENADLILDVISQDKETMTNHCLLSYRYQQGLREVTQLIGYVNVYVGNVISNWVENVQPIHKKALIGNATTKELEYIKKQRKEDFYVDYYLKKHEKMDLMNKEGIFRPRMLDNAKIYLNIIEKLKGLTKLYGAVNDKLIRSYIKMEFRKEKIPLSIIGEQLSTQDVSSIMNLYISRAKVQKQIDDLQKKILNNKGNFEENQDQEIMLTELRNNLQEAIDVQVEELEHYIKISEKYNKIENDTT